MRPAHVAPRLVLCLLVACGLAACGKKKAAEPVKAAAAPAQRHEVSADRQTVIDHQTGLEWKRCVEGRRFLMNACMGDTRLVAGPALQHYIDQNATPEGWRLPTQAELGTIITATYPAPDMKLEYVHDPDLFPPPVIDSGMYYWVSQRAGEVQQTVTGWYTFEGRLLGHGFGSDGEHTVRLVRPLRR